MDVYISDTISYRKIFLFAAIFIVIGFATTFLVLTFLIKTSSPAQVATASSEKNVATVVPKTPSLPKTLSTETIRPEIQATVLSEIATTTTTASTSTTLTSSSTNKALAVEKPVSAQVPALPSPPLQPEIVKLSVPYFFQEYANSCEAATLRMALAYYGITTNDMEVTRAFGYKPRLKDIQKNEWDDPQEMFVGFIDGIERNQGYGVYGEPVLKSLKEFGRTGEYKTSITAQYLAKEIKAGHPIIIWGYTNISTPYTWASPTGKTVKAFKGEHARLVVGIKGPTENPLGFYLHDPQTEAQYEYWDTQKLFDNIYAVPGVTNQAVVVK